MHQLEIEVSELLRRNFGFGDEVLLGKNGSDCTTWAVRTARAAMGKPTIVCSGYHGWHDWLAPPLGFRAPAVPADMGRHIVRLPYRDEKALEDAVT